MVNMSSTTNDTTVDTGLGTNVQIFMYSTLLVMSLIGNVLVITVVCGNKNLRTVFNAFIVNMAISDLFIPLLALPIKIVEVATEKQNIWIIHGGFGNATCKIFILLIDISPGVTVFSLVVIAINRFAAIVKPMSHAELFSIKRCKIMIALTWISVTVFFSPYFYVYRTTTFKSYNVCEIDWIEPFDNTKSLIIFTSFLIVIFFVSPFTLIIFLYSIIIYKLHADSKTVVEMLDSQEARKRKLRNKQIFFLSVAMIVAFAVFWGPFFMFLFTGLIKQNLVIPNVYLIVQFLGYTNSVINPLIYFIFMRRFRLGLKLLFCKCLENEPHRSPTVSNTRSLFLTTKDGVNEEKIKLKFIGNCSSKQDCVGTRTEDCKTPTPPSNEVNMTTSKGCLITSRL
ncbi:octopamine receptor 1-like [Actinia tenebrosa]|uniref:Octopamine receptor 1-like n=1 Tax=Actinia tenebrosa TaxID=6105 RepID=A0A6P8J8L3_ACTTE|nr:octopamine receptor 1-like [Actinia tenebrosa]XP_031574086.1 octopamine receptor 1-like [Actinia tenebrosa]XP_031574094.1 octopamine receptor 1-like [Actinia tenebrosa]XP_031574101.1 octopamine receptor 1-like [Actinia tenebrosa]XP_031574107.1 octopamine receptor 1-like [Actinia tenebrosa]XP_031574115.1 octopamine receptor 1-like [Actinia tenebrosa]XP_031574123.1 octopamine receptor 1-like [Actinia tenebrosa]XP_031574133.1 octopamine receptor 1-like [Actinia tenebrosa]